MPRSVNAVASRARRKKILNRTKGYWGRGKNVWTVAKNKWEKGQTYAYRDRKNKKREFRSLWINRINAGCRINGISYSVFSAIMERGISKSCNRSSSQSSVCILYNMVREAFV